MKTYKLISILLLPICFTLVSCQDKNSDKTASEKQLEKTDAQRKSKREEDSKRRQENRKAMKEKYGSYGD